MRTYLSARRAAPDQRAGTPRCLHVSGGDHGIRDSRIPVGNAVSRRTRAADRPGAARVPVDRRPDHGAGGRGRQGDVPRGRRGRADGRTDRTRPRRGVRGVRPDDRRQGVRRRSARPRPVRREGAPTAAGPGREASPVRGDHAAAALAPDEEERPRGVGVRDPEPVLVPHPRALRHLDDQRPDHDVRRQVPDPGRGRHGLRRRLAAGRPARHRDHRRDGPLRPDVPGVGLPAHAVLADPQRRADGGPGRLRQGGARRAADHHRDAGGRPQAGPAERRALLLPGPLHGQGGRRP